MAREFRKGLARFFMVDEDAAGVEDGEHAVAIEIELALERHDPMVPPVRESRNSCEDGQQSRSR